MEWFILTDVYIVADEDDKKMWRIFPGLLSPNFLIANRTAGLSVGRAELLIGKLPDAAEIQPHNAIIIFKNMPPPACGRLSGGQTVAVVDSSADAGLLEAVSRTMLPAITCGLSARDTLTLSSFGADNAAVTLQRSIQCFDGSVAEPQEIPLTLDVPMDSFTLMAAVSVFVLTGKIERLRQADFRGAQFK